MLRYKLLSLLGALSILGCASAPKNADLEIQGLRNQVSVLETQLKEKDQQVIYLQDALDKEAKQRAELTSQIDALSGHAKPAVAKASVKQTQLALKNAGYDPGPIDGQIGSKTRKAIRYFQQSSGLPITGKVDKDTWIKLKEYLREKEEKTAQVE